VSEHMEFTTQFVPGLFVLATFLPLYADLFLIFIELPSIPRADDWKTCPSYASYEQEYSLWY
jgi:hypothetical protein